VVAKPNETQAGQQFKDNLKRPQTNRTTSPNKQTPSITKQTTSTNTTCDHPEYKLSYHPQAQSGNTYCPVEQHQSGTYNNTIKRNTFTINKHPTLVTF
jgi:hypothetical protein